MALRFRRSIKLAPGIRLNVGKRGVSISAGVRGASVSFGSRGIYSNVSIPGTGLSYRTKLGGSSQRRASARQSFSRSSPVIESVEIILALQDDGTVKFRDKQGNDLPSRLVRTAREQHTEHITDWLEEQCASFNQGIDDLLNIHHTTPSPDTEISFAPESFSVAKPQPPIPRKLGFWSRFFRKRRMRIICENAEAQRTYGESLQRWEQHKHAFAEEQERRRYLVEEGRFHDHDAMQQFMEEALAGIVWPRETTVEFQIEDDGRTVFLDVDLPEIEDMPEQQASVATRGMRLIVKDRSERQRRQEYAIHIHGIGFRLVGEVFVALPSISAVVFSGYSQRLDKATGRILDEYLYSVKITRDAWSQIDFGNLAAVDVIEALGSFDIRRKMTKTGLFTPIEPFQPERV